MRGPSSRMSLECRGRAAGGRGSRGPGLFSMSSADHFTLRDRPSGRELVLRTIAGHAPSLLGTARRYSLCADDAQDAYQRALEIFLRRADSVDPAHAVGWLRTVVKHEALAVRAGRLRLGGGGRGGHEGQGAV